MSDTTKDAVPMSNDRKAFKEFHAALARLSANTSVPMEDRVMILSNATFLIDEYARAVSASANVAPNFDLKHAEDFAADAKRLALELECILCDCKDVAIVSKWCDSAIEALEQHREILLKSEQEYPCVHADMPKGCYRVRCQLGNKCVDDDMSPRSASSSTSTGDQS